MKWQHEMDIRVLILLTLFFLCVSSWGCDRGRSQHARGSANGAVTGDDPRDEFMRLAKTVEARSGRIYAKDDDLVKWRRTEQLIVYELRDHTVVVSPPDWNEHKVDIIMFCGHVKQGLDALYAVQHNINVDGNEYVASGIDSRCDLSRLRSIGYSEFRLGDHRDNVIDKQAAYLRRYFRSFPQEADREIRLLEGDLNRISGQRDDSVFFGLYTEDSRVIYMEVWTRGFAPLGSLLIMRPNNKVLAEGQFALQAAQ